MNATELHELQTQRFIDEDESRVVFRRPQLAADGAGGFRVSGHASLAGQRSRVVGNVRPPTVVTGDGRQVSINKAVVGMPNLDVEIGDLFDHDNRTYEVVNIQDSPGWHRVAEATLRG